MQLEQAFDMEADPDVAYAFLLDVNRVAACVPGVELTEVVDPDTFRGTLRVKVGPITVQYRGTASIVSRDPATRTATVHAEGAEGGNPGAVRADATMTVEPTEAGSRVRFVTDVMIAGRLAQFGRGMIDAVAKKIVAEMAACIRDQLTSGDVSAADGAAGRSVSAIGLVRSVVADKVRGRG